MCHTDQDVTPVLTHPNTHARETNHGREYDPPSSKHPPTSNEAKRHRRPNSESGCLQSSGAGVRYPGAAALGSPARRALSWASLEPSTPTAARATAGTGGSGGGLVYFLLPAAPPPQKITRIVAPHTCSSARHHRYSKGSMGGPTHRSAATGFELAPSGLAPSAPPLGQRPPQIEYTPPQRTAIGAPLQILSLLRPTPYTPEHTHVCA